MSIENTEDVNHDSVIWVDFLSWKFEQMFKEQLIYGESTFDSIKFEKEFEEWKNNLKKSE